MEYLLRSAFREKDCVAFRILDKDGHHAPGKVEGDFVELLILFDQSLLMKIRTAEDRRVQQVLEPRLEVADEVTVEQYLVRFPPGHVAVPLQYNTIFSERAGLIGAQHVHAAEILDGIEPLDDHLSAAHRNRAFGEAYGNDHRQHLGSEAYRDCDEPQKGDRQAAQC